MDRVHRGRHGGVRHEPRRDVGPRAQLARSVVRAPRGRAARSARELIRRRAWRSWGFGARDKSRWGGALRSSRGDVAALVRDGKEVHLQASGNRCFSDEEFRQAGATVVPTLDAADVVLGIKEVPLHELRPGKAYFFFSHTIKGQPHNMPMLRRMLDLGCSLFGLRARHRRCGRAHDRIRAARGPRGRRRHAMAARPALRLGGLRHAVRGDAPDAWSMGTSTTRAQPWRGVAAEIRHRGVAATSRPWSSP